MGLAMRKRQQHDVLKIAACAQKVAEVQGHERSCWTRDPATATFVSTASCSCRNSTAAAAGTGDKVRRDGYTQRHLQAICLNTVQLHRLVQRQQYDALSVLEVKTTTLASAQSRTYSIVAMRARLSIQYSASQLQSAVRLTEAASALAGANGGDR